MGHGTISELGCDAEPDGGVDEVEGQEIAKVTDEALEILLLDC